MINNHKGPAMGNTNKVAMVVFDLHQPEGIQKEYAYFIDSSLELEKNDVVVVETINSGTPQLKIVKVVSVLENNLENAHIINKANKYIVDKIDLTNHLNRKEKADRLKFIKKKLAEHKEKAEEVAIFEMMAKTNPEAAALLDEMKELMGLEAPKGDIHASNS